MLSTGGPLGGSQAGVGAPVRIGGDVWVQRWEGSSSLEGLGSNNAYGEEWQQAVLLESSPQGWTVRLQSNTSHEASDVFVPITDGLILPRGSSVQTRSRPLSGTHEMLHVNEPDLLHALQGVVESGQRDFRAGAHLVRINAWDGGQIVGKEVRDQNDTATKEWVTERLYHASASGLNQTFVFWGAAASGKTSSCRVVFTHATAGSKGQLRQKGFDGLSLVSAMCTAPTRYSTDCTRCVTVIRLLSTPPADGAHPLEASLNWRSVNIEALCPDLEPVMANRGCDSGCFTALTNAVLLSASGWNTRQEEWGFDPSTAGMHLAALGASVGSLQSDSEACRAAAIWGDEMQRLLQGGEGSTTDCINRHKLSLDDVVRILIGIVWVGQLNILEESESNGSASNGGVVIEMNAASDAACACLGVHFEALQEAITVRKIQASGSSDITTASSSLKRALAIRLSLMRSLYRSLLHALLPSQAELKAADMHGQNTGALGSTVTLSLVDMGQGMLPHQDQLSKILFRSLREFALDWCLLEALRENEQSDFPLSQSSTSSKNANHFSSPSRWSIGPHPRASDTLLTCLAKTCLARSKTQQRSMIGECVRNAAEGTSNNRVGGHTSLVWLKERKDVSAFTVQHYGRRVDYDASSLLTSLRCVRDGSLLQLTRTSCVKPLAQVVESYVSIHDTEANALHESASNCRNPRLLEFAAGFSRLANIFANSEPHFTCCLLANTQKASGFADSKTIRMQLLASSLIESLESTSFSPTLSCTLRGFINRFCSRGEEEPSKPGCWDHDNGGELLRDVASTLVRAGVQADEAALQGGRVLLSSDAIKSLDSLKNMQSRPLQKEGHMPLDTADQQSGEPVRLTQPHPDQFEDASQQARSGSGTEKDSSAPTAGMQGSGGRLSKEVRRRSGGGRVQTSSPSLSRIAEERDPLVEDLALEQDGVDRPAAGVGQNEILVEESDGRAWMSSILPKPAEEEQAHAQGGVPAASIPETMAAPFPLRELHKELSVDGDDDDDSSVGSIIDDPTAHRLKRKSEKVDRKALVLISGMLSLAFGQGQTTVHSTRLDEQLVSQLNDMCQQVLRLYSSDDNQEAFFAPGLVEFVHAVHKGRDKDVPKAPRGSSRKHQVTTAVAMVDMLRTVKMVATGQLASSAGMSKLNSMMTLTGQRTESHQEEGRDELAMFHSLSKDMISVLRDGENRVLALQNDISALEHELGEVTFQGPSGSLDLQSRRSKDSNHSTSTDADARNMVLQAQVEALRAEVSDLQAKLAKRQHISKVPEGKMSGGLHASSPPEPTAIWTRSRDLNSSMRSLVRDCAEGSIANDMADGILKTLQSRAAKLRQMAVDSNHSDDSAGIAQARDALEAFEACEAIVQRRMQDRKALQHLNPHPSSSSVGLAEIAEAQTKIKELEGRWRRAENSFTDMGRLSEWVLRSVSPAVLEATHGSHARSAVRSISARLEMLLDGTESLDDESVAMHRLANGLLPPLDRTRVLRNIRPSASFLCLAKDFLVASLQTRSLLSPSPAAASAPAHQTPPHMRGSLPSSGSSVEHAMPAAALGPSGEREIDLPHTHMTSPAMPASPASSSSAVHSVTPPPPISARRESSGSDFDSDAPPIRRARPANGSLTGEQAHANGTVEYRAMRASGRSANTAGSGDFRPFQPLKWPLAHAVPMYRHPRATGSASPIEPDITTSKHEGSEGVVVLSASMDDNSTGTLYSEVEGKAPGDVSDSMQKSLAPTVEPYSHRQPRHVVQLARAAAASESPIFHSRPPSWTGTSIPQGGVHVDHGIDHNALNTNNGSAADSEQHSSHQSLRGDAPNGRKSDRSMLT